MTLYDARGNEIPESEIPKPTEPQGWFCYQSLPYVYRTKEDQEADKPARDIVVGDVLLIPTAFHGYLPGKVAEVSEKGGYAEIEDILLGILHVQDGEWYCGTTAPLELARKALKSNG